MRLNNSVRKIALEDKLSRMRPLLDTSIREAGFDPDLYSDVQGLIDALPGMMPVIQDGDPVRFRGGYRLWASVARDDHPDHWMNPLCSSTDTHMPMTVDELHGREDYKSTVLDHTGPDFLRMIEKHLTLWHVEGLAHIIYTQVDSEVGAGIIQKLQMTHPYTAACSLHEFFKLLLEWQWALFHASNTEPVAQLASDVLLHLGLNVDDVDSNKVVRDLMELPDMQVAQYIKTGVCTLNNSTPEMPLSFRLWASEKQLMEEPRPLLAQLYNDCVSYKSIEDDLARL